MARRPLLLLALLLVATRLLLLACGADVHGYGEEFAKGAAAKVLLDGTGLEAWRLPYVPHEGGGFVVTHLKAALFVLVGPSVLANKLVALGWSLLILVALFAFGREHAGPRAAQVAGIFFAFAPESFLRFSLLSLGTHYEALLFVLAALHLALRIRTADSPRARDAFALGLAAGFGAYFSLIVLPALATAALLLVTRGPLARLGRTAAWAAAGIAVGVLPWIWMASHVGRDAWSVRGEGTTGGAADPLQALGIVVARLAEPDLGRWLLLATGLTLVPLGLVLAWRASAAPATKDARPRTAIAALVVHLALFLLAYSASGFALRPDASWFFFLRCAPAWITVVLLAAIAAAALHAAGGVRRAFGRVLLGSWLVVGAADLVRLCAAGRPSAPLENLRLVAVTRGYDYAQYFDKLIGRLEGERTDKLARLARIDDDRALLLPELALSTYEHAGVPLSAALAELHATLGDDAPVAITGLRFFVHPQFGHDLDAAFAALEAAPEADRPALAEAIGRAGLGPRFRADRLQEQVRRPIAHRWRERFLVGAGWRLYRTFPLRPDLAHAFVAEEAPEIRQALERGYTDAFRRATLAGAR